jgi:cell wall-associated NlpC family hydrolase
VRLRRPVSPVQARRWIRATAVFGVSAVAALSLQASSAAQPRPSVAEVAARVDALNERAEAIAEQFNASGIALTQAQRKAAIAEARVARAEAALREQRRRLGTIAAAAYRNGGVGGTTALMISSNPQDYLDQATTLDRISARGADRMLALRTASVRVAQAKAEAKAQVSAVRAINSAIAEKRTQVNALLAQAEHMLAGLRADERARLDALRRAQAQRASRDETRYTFSGPASARAQIAIDFALSQRGKPYQWGSAGPNSYDCSGLTMRSYSKAGISLDHYTGSQWNAGRHVSRSELRPGDLVFFYSDHHHVGLYLGGGQMVHAPHSGTVVQVSSIDGREFSGGVRVVG